MDIDRRSFLTGIGFLGLTEAWGRDRRPPAGSADLSARSRWHPLTRTLIDRAMAGSRPDRLRVERTVHDLAEQGLDSRPVIKWMESPTDAFDHLSRYGLDVLLQMGTASFWHDSLSPPAFDEEVLERSFDPRCLAAEVLRIDYWDRALMVPKLAAKSNEMAMGALPDAIFRARAVAAQIGWLETSLPATAVEALCNIEMLLSSDFPERSMPIYHQLLVFRAWEHGLLATWETPDALICVPRSKPPSPNASLLANFSEEPVTCPLH